MGVHHAMARDPEGRAMRIEARVYVMRTSKPGVVKVGLSKNPKWREWELSSIGATIVYMTAPHPRAHAIEARAHRVLRDRRVGNGRELFRCSQRVAIEAIDAALAEEGDPLSAPAPAKEHYVISVKLDRETYLMLDGLRRAYGARRLVTVTEAIRCAIKTESRRMAPEIKAAETKRMLRSVQREP